jgi:hypothetical protein
LEARNAESTDHLSGTTDRKPALAIVNQAVRVACHNDYVAHCNGMTVPSDELRGCMRANSLKLSKPCLQALVDNKEATKADVDKYLEETRKGK